MLGSAEGDKLKEIFMFKVDGLIGIVFVILQAARCDTTGSGTWYCSLLIVAAGGRVTLCSAAFGACWYICPQKMKWVLLLDCA